MDSSSGMSWVLRRGRSGNHSVKSIIIFSCKKKKYINTLISLLQNTHTILHNMSEVKTCDHGVYPLLSNPILPYIFQAIIEHIGFTC